MAYTNSWDESAPDGSTAQARDIDNIIRDLKKDLRERLVDLLDIDDFADDPLAIGDLVIASLSVNGLGRSVSYDAGDSGTSKTITWTNGNSQHVKLTGDCTFTFTGLPVGAYGTLYLRQDETGSRIPTFPADVVWPSAAEPLWTPTANKIDVVTFYRYNSNTLLAFPGGLNFSYNV